MPLADQVSIVDALEPGSIVDDLDIPEAGLKSP